MLSADVLLYHNDTFNDGQNLNEAELTTANVNTTSFGKLLAVPLDGIVRGEPLIRSNLDVATGPLKGIQNVAFVATNNDSVYAINADNGVVLWKTSLLTKFHGASDSVHAGSGGSGFAQESTPVIDPATNVLYVESEESDNSNWVHMLSSLNIADGSQFANPVDIAEGSNNSPYISGPSVNKPGGGKTVFDARDLQSRCLTLDPANGTIYLSYGDEGDVGPYNGWVLGYSSSKDPNGNLNLKAVWCATPDGSEAGIWQGGGGIAVDAAGNLFVETGNGSFDTTLATPGYVADGRLTALTDNANISGGLKTPNHGDYGDSFLKLTADSDTSQQSDNPNGYGLHVSDYFTPKDEASISSSDTDLGSSSPVLLPDSVGSSSHTQLLVGNDKQGIIYLLDRNNLGQYHGDVNGQGAGSDNVVQALSGTTGSWSTAAFYAGSSPNSGTIYYVTQADVGRAFSISNAHISSAPTSTTTSYGSYSFPGSTPVISADGATNAILWTLDKSPNRLIAYDATNLKNLLFRSDQGTGNALSGQIQTFNTPTVANGHVFVATGNDLNIYGLKSTAHLAAISLSDGTTAYQSQRSEVRQITLTFSMPVTLNPGAVSLFLLNTGGSGSNDGSPPTDVSGALASPTTPDGGKTWVLTFDKSDSSSVDATGSLMDGIYTLTLNPAQISGSTLGGGNLSTTFHRLFGDITGSRTVNNLDYLMFKKSYLSSTGDAAYNADFDYDANGIINNLDYLQFKRRYLMSFTY